MTLAQMHITTKSFAAGTPGLRFAIHPIAVPATLPTMTPHLALTAARGALPAWFDRDGFLEHGERWTPALAEEIAEADGVGPLGAAHWQVIRLVRERYTALGALPVMRLVCRAAGIEPGRAHHLFPNCRSLWRIAGLPDPGEEAKAYMN